eukprot:4544230-Prymnesium_polylepis.1
MRLNHLNFLPVAPKNHAHCACGPKKPRSLRSRDPHPVTIMHTSSGPTVAAPGANIAVVAAAVISACVSDSLHLAVRAKATVAMSEALSEAGVPHAKMPSVRHAQEGKGKGKE